MERKKGPREVTNEMEIIMEKDLQLIKGCVDLLWIAFKGRLVLISSEDPRETIQEAEDRTGDHE